MKNKTTYGHLHRTFLLVLCSLLVITTSSKLKANAAQPGMWQAGGMANFSLHYPQDSAAFGKIQMQKELVSILLYKGFAVVKGEYWMRNDSDTSLQIRTGYPINASSEPRSRDKMEIWFDELYGLKVFTDGKETPLLKEEEIENWYVWENNFPKGKTTKIEVYFLMDTNQASILQGYTKNYSNGFVYLLETGAIWKQPIGSGEIRLQLKDDLDFKSVRGIHPQQFFDINEKEKIIRGSFQNLTPTFDDNIVISYGERLKDFNFEKVLADQNKYFAVADKWSRRDLSSVKFDSHSFDDPFVIKTFENGKPSGLWAWIQLGFWGVVSLIAGLIVWLIFRRVRK